MESTNHTDAIMPSAIPAGDGSKTSALATSSTSSAGIDSTEIAVQGAFPKLRVFGCFDECGTHVTEDPAIPGWTPGQIGWTILPLHANRYRCPDCVQALMRINARKGFE